MAAAVVSNNAPNRPSGSMVGLVVIPISIVLSATAYATATGGFAFDIATILNNAGAFDSGVNPTDVFQITGKTSGNFLVSDFVVGTATYNTTSDTSFRNKTTLATCPCTARLFGTGSANQAALAEPADGNKTDTVTAYLWAMRGGSINQ